MSKVTPAAWKKAKRHTITLPSNTEVAIEIPNLPNLIKAGQLPNSLVQGALEVMQGKKVTQEMVNDQAEFSTKLVAMTVKEPEITEDDVADLPFEDVEMLVEIATRQRDLDAVGRHIGGLHTSDEFRTFRGLSGGDEGLAGI